MGNGCPINVHSYASLCEYSMASTNTPDKFPHIVYLVNRHRVKRITFVPRIFVSMILIYLLFHHFYVKSPDLFHFNGYSMVDFTFCKWIELMQYLVDRNEGIYWTQGREHVKFQHTIKHLYIYVNFSSLVLQNML